MRRLNGMSANPKKSLQQIVEEAGRYAEDAYLFVRSGLGFAVDRVHGPLTPPQRMVQQYMAEENLDLDDLSERIYASKLPRRIQEAIGQSGGLEKLNRHIGGQDLCWGLRDFAIRRWGPLTQMVLKRWGIHQTLDFGRIVFALVENEYMQKQPQDTLEDFEDVFDFRTAFLKPLTMSEEVEEETSNPEPES